MRVCTCIMLRAHARITVSFDDGDMHTCIRTGEHIFICTRISMSLLILVFCFWRPSIKHGCPCQFYHFAFGENSKMMDVIANGVYVYVYA